MYPWFTYISKLVMFHDFPYQCDCLPEGSFQFPGLTPHACRHLYRCWLVQCWVRRPCKAESEDAADGAFLLSYGNWLGFNRDLMGFNGDWIWFNGHLMGFNDKSMERFHFNPLIISCNGQKKTKVPFTGLVEGEKSTGNHGFPYEI